jgi:hypothetical protein
VEEIMEAVPYEIHEEDVDEVLNAYDPEWPEDDRREARQHVMRHVRDLDEIVRSAPEEETANAHSEAFRAGSIGDRPGDREFDRREMALAAIEDLLIRDRFIELDTDESRVFPVIGEPDSERDDG